jgi:hypothetical protein
LGAILTTAGSLAGMISLITLLGTQARLTGHGPAPDIEERITTAAGQAHRQLRKSGLQGKEFLRQSRWERSTPRAL